MPELGLAVETDTVTPVGRPDTAMLGVLGAPVTVTVQVLELPCTTATPLPQDDATDQLAVTVTVSVALLVSVPDVPVMVRANPPTVAVLLAVIVSTQLPLPVMGLVHPETVIPPDPAG